MQPTINKKEETYITKKKLIRSQWLTLREVATVDTPSLHVYPLSNGSCYCGEEANEMGDGKEKEVSERDAATWRTNAHVILAFLAYAILALDRIESVVSDTHDLPSNVQPVEYGPFDIIWMTDFNGRFRLIGVL